MSLTHSYVHGASDVPFLDTTIGVAFDETVARFPDRAALVVPHQSVRWSYRELQEKVDRCASALLSFGLEPGDRIGIWALNCGEWTVGVFASATAGLILVYSYPAARLSDREYASSQGGGKARISAARFTPSDYLGMLRTLAPERAEAEPGRLSAHRLPSLELVVQLGEDEEPGMMRFSELMDRGTPVDRERLDTLATELQFDDQINIQFTSGTTGLTKGATLTQHNILNNAFFVGGAMRLTE